MKHLITNNNECVEKSEIKIENVIPEIEKNEIKQRKWHWKWQNRNKKNNKE